MTKTCGRCGADKDISDFWLNRGKPQSKCKSCATEVYKIWRSKNVDHIRSEKAEQQRRYREANITYLRSVKSLKCESCGYGACFAALDFHHTDPTQKENVRDSMTRWMGLSPKTFRLKIDTNQFKILCATCHRELHAKERVN